MWGGGSGGSGGSGGWGEGETDSTIVGGPLLHVVPYLLY